MDDPTPLSSNQLRTLAAATTRELLWGLPAVSAEIRRWRQRALEIPNPRVRADALSALSNKRTHADGAALFWILPRRRNRDLLGLLVSYELIWDFLDNLSERAAAAGQVDGRQLHLAIVEAIDPSCPISDYHRDCPWREDGGYLHALVESCRRRCVGLPSYSSVQAMAVANAERAQVLAVNHDPNAARRDASLQRWVEEHCPNRSDFCWWELSGAASAPLTIHALLALAAEKDCRTAEVEAVQNAYFPWLSAATTMLDSYVDQAEDRENGDHSYIGHYPSKEIAARSVGRLVSRAALAMRDLPRGPKHSIIAAGMAAMYLSKNSAAAPGMVAGTRDLAEAGGSLTKLLLPILRTWRTAYAQRSS